MSETHSTAILSRPQFGDIIPNSNNNYNNRLISFEMMYEDSCFSAATSFFFLRLGKSDAVNVPVCHRVCDSWWHQGAADWPSLPHAAEVERGVNASPAAQRYISVSAGASTRSVCRRHPQPEPHPERWDIYSSRILKNAPARHTRSDSVQFIWAGGKEGKVGRDEFSVPAPDQPAGRPQQPARSPADRGLFVRSDAPAGRLLQLGYRWVTARCR